jgi:hypothetical protein
VKSVERDLHPPAAAWNPQRPREKDPHRLFLVEKFFRNDAGNVLRTVFGYIPGKIGDENILIGECNEFSQTTFTGKKEENFRFGG